MSLTMHSLSSFLLLSLMVFSFDNNSILHCLNDRKNCTYLPMFETMRCNHYTANPDR